MILIFDMQNPCRVSASDINLLISSAFTFLLTSGIILLIQILAWEPLNNANSDIDTVIEMFWVVAAACCRNRFNWTCYKYVWIKSNKNISRMYSINNPPVVFLFSPSQLKGYDLDELAILTLLFEGTAEVRVHP